jgi:hypothetical protein
MPVTGVRGRSEIAGWPWVVGIIVLLAVACGGADDSSEAPDADPTSYGSRTIDTSAAPGPPTVETEFAPPSHYREVDQAIEGLITRNATWQAPPSLQVNKTETVALAIGDVQALQDEITRAVPTVSPREPEAIEIGSRVRAWLTAGESDASVAPLEAINKSMGEQTSILFRWQVTPLKAGDLILSAHIEFPLADYVDTQTVDLRIPVAPAEQVKEPWTRTFQDLIKNYWVQLTTAGGALLAGARLGWGWYKRRQAVPVAAAAEVEPTADAGEQAGATGQPDAAESANGTGGARGAGSMDTERR